MVTFLLFVVIGLLVYLVCEYKKHEPESRQETSYREILPSFLNKNCEVILKKPLLSIDLAYSAKGILVDMDEDWIMLERQEKKKKVVKVLRIELVSGVKEIKEPFS